ncbi:9624_t:CDS:2, partial [Entrophospora sp. SA101]
YLKPELDIKTRWNSTYYMIKKFQKLEPSLRMLAANERVINDLLPTNEGSESSSAISNLCIKFQEYLDEYSIIQELNPPQTNSQYNYRKYFQQLKNHKSNNQSPQPSTLERKMNRDKNRNKIDTTLTSNEEQFLIHLHYITQNNVEK